MDSLDELESFINFIPGGMHALSFLFDEAAENCYKIIHELIQKLGSRQKILKLIDSHYGNGTNLILQSKISFVSCNFVS